VTAPQPGARDVRALRGRLVQAAYARGSKSERDAIWLETDDGTLLARMRQGPSFPPYGLEHLLDTVVDCDGTVVSRRETGPGGAPGTGHDLLLIDRVTRAGRSGR
jgi:hypothetical protein